nr:nitroreductase family deazaflavin-dependent oxidoreductase [Streptomyces sp. CBMA152]
MALIPGDGDDAEVSPHNWGAEQARLYAESGGTEGTTFEGAPCLLMDYVGRRSGTVLRTVLIYGRDGDDYLVVGSKGGSPTHPLWYLNIVAEPDVRVRVGTQRFAARAETLSPEEKARVWPRLVALYAPYEEYDRRIERDIPVVRLRRTDN